MKQAMTYIPGVCNIGPAEVRLRRAAGMFGLILTIIMVGVFIMFDIPPALRTVLFIPVTLAVVGFLQARLHFCVDFAMRGLFNLSDDVTRQESVDQTAYRRKDQRKALLIIIASLMAGCVSAFVAYVV